MSSSPGTKACTHQRRKAELPVTDSLVADLESSLEEQLGDVLKAELVTQSPEHCDEHDVRWKLQIIERCARSLVELPPA